MAECQVCDFENGRRRRCEVCGQYACKDCRTDVRMDYGTKLICGTCEEIYDKGKDNGEGAGQAQDPLAPGDPLPDDPDLDMSDYPEGVVTEANREEIFTSMALEGEMHARDFSPWEFTAAAINSYPQTHNVDEWVVEELWELYDLGVQHGVEAAYEAAYGL